MCYTASNLPFQEGAIVFLTDLYCTGSLAPLKSRPMLIVSFPEHTSGYVITAETGTGVRPGIEVHLRNFGKANGWIGNHDTSYVLPYALHTVPVMAIYSVCGYLRKHLFDEVRRAVAYELGVSDKAPHYVDPPEPIGYHMCEMRDPKNMVENGRIWNVDPIVRGGEATRAIMDDTGDELLKPTVWETDEEEIRRSNEAEGAAVLPEMPKSISMNMSKVYTRLTDEDIAMIIGRSITLNDMMERYGCTYSVAYQIRKLLDAQHQNPSIIRRAKNQLAGNVDNYRYIDRAVAVATALYGTPTSLGLTPAAFETIRNRAIADYGINCDKRIWKGVDLETIRKKLEAEVSG